jgi:hypothetical protein
LDFKVENHLPKLTKQLEQQIEQRMRKAVYRVHRQLTGILSGSRSGKVYRVPGTRRTYTASAPGQAPAVRLGDLRTSYRPVVEGKGWNSVGKVGTPMDYGAFLEHGTSRMSKRPHLRPAFDQTEAEWQGYFKDLI